MLWPQPEHTSSGGETLQHVTPSALGRWSSPTISCFLWEGVWRLTEGKQSHAWSQGGILCAWGSRSCPSQLCLPEHTGWFSELFILMIYFYYFFSSYTCAWEPARGFTHLHWGVCKSQKRVLKPLLTLQVIVSSLTWELGTELLRRSSTCS